MTLSTPAARSAGAGSEPAALAPELPSRARPRGDAPLERLFEAEVPPVEPARGVDDGELAARYAGPLRIALRDDRPSVVANFVETIDGIVALDADGRTGGGEVSGFSPTDRFVMGLLRALADVVLVGAATVRASDRGLWTPDSVSPAHAPAWAALRGRLGLAPEPTTLVATATGRLDAGHRVFADPTAPVVVAGAPAVVPALRRALPGHVRIEPIDPALPAGTALVAVARRLGARLVLSEGGPHLIGGLVADGLLDELFLTLAPQIAGRAVDVARLGLVEGTALWPAAPRWLRLRSVRRAGDHLFLRYASEERV